MKPVRPADPAIREIFAVLPAARRHSRMAKGIGLYLACLALYGLTGWGMFASQPWLAGLCVAANGVTIAMLFLIGHDACHNSLTPSRWVNRLVGRLAFLPTFHLFSGWAKSHNLKHHAYTNLKGFDPGYSPFTKEEFDQLSWGRRLRERIYRTPFGIGFYYFLELWWLGQLFPSGDDVPPNRTEFQWDRVLVLSYIALQCAAVYALTRWLGYQYPVAMTALFVFVPWSVFLWFMGFVTLQQHTHPDVPWFDNEEEWNFYRAHVAGTVHVKMPWLIEAFFLNIFEHGAHHVDPLIPLYELAPSQKALVDAYTDDIRVVQATPLSFWKTLRCCKLYDYRRHEWLDFRGRTTAKAQLPKLGAPATVLEAAG
jgi:omega-6 fatty acid desaturase (delta-12 desaturase)